jgi:hypothetical protein
MLQARVYTIALSDDRSGNRGYDVLMILSQFGDEEPLYIERERETKEKLLGTILIKVGFRKPA